MTPPTFAPHLNLFTGCREQNGLGAALTNPTTLSQRKGTISPTASCDFSGHGVPGRGDDLSTTEVAEQRAVNPTS